MRAVAVAFAAGAFASTALRAWLRNNGNQALLFGDLQTTEWTSSALEWNHVHVLTEDVQRRNSSYQWYSTRECLGSAFVFDIY